MVSQIVKTMRFQTGIRQNLLKDFPYSRLRQMTSVRMRENQIWKSVIVPVAPGCLFLRKLPGLMVPKHIHHKLRRRQCSRLIVFQRPVVELFTLHPRLNKLLGNPNQPVFKIHAIPSEAQKLARPHPREDGDHDERFVLMPFHAFHQFFQIGRIKRMDFRLGNPRQNTGAAGVFLDIPDPNGNIQRFVQAAMDILNRFRAQPLGQFTVV